MAISLVFSSLLSAVAVLIFSSGGALAQNITLGDLCSSDHNQKDLNHSTVWLVEQSHHLVPSGSYCRAENVQNLTIRGSSDQKTVIQCEQNPDNVSTAVFSFLNATMLTIMDVHFVGCGASVSRQDVSDMSYIGLGQSAVLLCNHCSELLLSNVTFSENTGYAFIGINLHGNSLLDRVHVLGDDDRPRPRHDSMCNETGFEFVCRNRGIFLLFLDSDYEVPTGSITVSESSFEKNQFIEFNNPLNSTAQPLCVRRVFRSFVHPWFWGVEGPLPDVGALTIAYLQSKFRANVSVLNSTFSENHGECFGAIFSLYHTTSVDYASQTISGCTFVDNSPTYYPDNEEKNFLGSDVTVYMQYNENNNSLGSFPCITIEESYFKNFHSKQTPDISVLYVVDTHGKCQVTLREVTTNTSAKLLYVSSLTQHGVLEVLLEDIVMNAKNTPREYNIKGLDQNDGLLKFVHIDNVTILGTSEEKCQFNTLLGPVIVLYSSQLSLTGELLFANLYASNGVNGAAINLQSTSGLWLSEPLKADFCNNSAVSGGSIATGEEVEEFCVFQYHLAPGKLYDSSNISQINISLTFTGNVAQLAGNAIYVQQMHNCSVRVSAGMEIWNVNEIYDVIFEFESTVNNSLLEVSSYPQQICLCDDLLTNTSRSALNCAQDTLAGVETIHTYPGKDFSVNIVAVDDIYNPVYTSMYNRLLPRSGYNWIYGNDDFHARLGYKQDIVKIYGYNCTRLNFTVLNSVSEYSEILLSLYPYEQVDCLALPVVVYTCPPGFTLMDEGYCDCSQLLAEKEFKCDINTGNVSRPDSTVWVGVVQEGSNGGGGGGGNLTYDDNNASSVMLGYSSYCPRTYCNNLTEVDIQDPAMVCENGRVGVLCGQCPENMSMAVGLPYSCQECSNLWLLTLPLYALAGIALVVLMFVLRLTLATGTINGLIFFANLFSFNLLHVLSFQYEVWLVTFLSVLNLKLGFPVCLYDGLNMIEMTYMGFLVPVYLWAIVLVIIMLSRWFTAVAKLTRRSAIPVLATIIHLSFSKLLNLSVSGLSVLTLETETEDGNRSHTHVWYYDGSVQYAHRGHAGLVLLSLVSLIFFIAPYTIFLVGIKFFVRFKFTNRVRPFVDAFCAPYKDKWRFWFGLRLLVLVVLYIMFALLHSNADLLNLFEVLVLLLFTVLQASIMPYRSIVINYLDLFFLVSALLLDVVLVSHTGYKITSNVFMIAVFVAFCGIVCYHVYMVVGPERFRCLVPFLARRTRRSVKEELNDEAGSQEGSGRSSERVSERSSLNTTGTGATYSTLLVNNPHSVHHYKPHKFREPLLDSSSDSDEK